MCGFIGRIRNSESTYRPPSLLTGLPFLGRRGPDSHREWKSENESVELLHVRLAIVDTDSRAHQPYTVVEHGITVVLNGEIYNYQELRNELSDFQFHTTSDTEVVGVLFAREGIKGLQRLRGMFSMVIADSRARRVFLVRDPVGKKPFFLADLPSGKYFGSSILPLVAASGEPQQIDSSVIEYFWEEGYIPPNASVLKRFKPIAPGQVIELDWNGNIRAEHSCIPEYKPEAPPKDLAEIHERISTLVSQSVGRRLTNNPNPVCLLSGGIDSTVVAMHMKRQGVGSAITLGSLIPRQLDEKYARQAATKLAMPLQIVKAKPGRMADEFLWAIDLQDEPMGMMAFFPLAMMVRSAKEYGKILLTGDGGDEVFLGYGQPKDWTDKKDGGFGFAGLDDIKVGTASPAWMGSWGRRTISASLLGHMFTKLDRATAEQGVEGRCPLLDWDLMMFVRSLTPEQLFYNSQPKALLKAELKDWPQSFVERPKMGFPYRLRWVWALKGFSDFRDLIARDVIDTFESMLPIELRKPPSRWKNMEILRNFAAAWKLLAWSRFQHRLGLASTSGMDHHEILPEVSMING